MTFKFLHFHSKKRGVSLMLSYVLLISIAIIMAITVYASLKLIANVKPVASCEPGTSIIIESYSCTSTPTSKTFVLNLNNNGLFSVSGVIVAYSVDDTQIPVT